MSKVVPFKERFKGQIQSIGKKGIRDTQAKEPIIINPLVEQQNNYIQPLINMLNGIV